MSEIPPQVDSVDSVTASLESSSLAPSLPSPNVQSDECAQCGFNINSDDSVERRNLLRCSACKSTYYCNKECQEAHWEIHKAECSTIKTNKTHANSASSSSVKGEGESSMVDQVTAECGICMDDVCLYLTNYLPCCGHIVCSHCYNQWFGKDIEYEEVSIHSPFIVQGM